MPRQTPVVSVAMIARDEQRCIGRALTSVRHLVDDMVVVDTGSVDDTAGIAVDHGARVHQFTWIDDFSAARNHALSLAAGDYVLFLDADEWISRGGIDVLRQWAARADTDAAGEILVLSTGESDGTPITTRVHLPRLLPRRNCRYIGRVHEQPTGYTSSSAVSELVVAHDGYQPVHQRRKRGRNEALLRAMLTESPRDPYLTFQLGRERQLAGDHTAAAALYHQALPATPAAAPWRDELSARTLFTTQRANRTDEALTLAGRLVRQNPSAEVLFSAGNLFLDVALERPAQAQRFTAMARSAWKACLEVGEPPDGRDGTQGCGSFLAAANLAALCEAEGDAEGHRHWAAEAQRMREAAE